ncbi:MAG: hypothetical protein IJA41_00485 [Clostridia bacterium]|nr:hypothetical protein [Clostridia bacterium]
MIRKSFKKALCLLCAVALIASTLVVMSVSASAAAISSDENIFTCLETKETETYTFQTESGNDISGAASAGNGKAIPGVASALNCLAGTTNKLYLRVSNRDTAANATLAMKWASPTTQKSGVMLGKTGSNIGSGTDQAYVLEDNTTYEISYDYINWNGTGLSLNLLGVSHASNIVLQDLDDEHTYTVLNSTSIDATAASKVWTTYTCKFTTGTLGNDKYLSFAVFREATTSLEFWLDNVKVSKVTEIDSDDVITFNDNGKTYYAYPDALTALPDGDNGALGSEFIGWVDADGNAVTEVPEAGAVLNAKYPFVTELPEKTDSLYLALTNTSEQNNIAYNAAKGILGVVSSSNSSHRIYSRNVTIADGSSAIIIKFANSWTSSRTVTFGKANVAASGADEAFIVEPNTKYTVSYNIKHESGAGVSFDIIAGAATNATSGYVFDSYAPETAANAWTVHTCSFTAPDAATLGANKYLQFAITVPEGEAISNVAYLYGVTITKVSAGDPADYISFVDGDDVYYTSVGDISALPKGQSADGDESFLGWYDGNGDRVTEVPTEAGVVLTAQYGVIKDGTVATSIREVSGSGSDYVSAGIRFRARLDSATVEVADEVGFILVPNGEAVDSENALKGVAKNKNTHIIYDLTYDGFIDYQVIVTGLTREGDDTNLCDLKIDVYFYYILNGDTNYVGQPYSTSYNEVLALYEADLPVVNNTLTEITTAPIGEAATDKLIGTALTLTPPEYKTTIGSASYLDAADGATLMTVTNTTKVEYEAYLAKLDTLGYTAVVGNSRILSSSQSFSAIYSDGTNLINVAFIASEKTVKATIEPLGFDNVDDVNSYLSIFHDASAANPETYVCDPLFLTIGLSTSENNNDDGLGFYHGLGYIYRLADGSFVIIDGGHSGDTYDHAGKIYSMLKYYAPDPENIVISAWIMTHAHGDHMYVFKSFAPKYLADEAYNVTLKNIIANLPNENWVADGGMPETNLAPFRTLYAECEARGTNVYKAHVGQVYNLPGFTTEMLYTLEQTAPTVENKSMSNTSSLIFRSVIEGKSFLITADATSTSINHVNAAFGKKMDSDFVQVPHHGTLSNFATDTRAELGKFYTDYTTPTYALWPSAEAGMNIYLAKTVDENINAILGTMMPYDHMIALGHNIEEIKLNSETVDIKTLEYYEIGYLRYEPQAITTEAELKAIADNPYGYYYLANDITVTEEFTAPYWSKFAGYLDGKGHTVTFANDIVFESAASNNGILCNSIQGVIRNVNFGSESAPLNIAYSETASGAMGLFGSTLADITFDNVKVYAEIAHTVSSSYGNYVGGFLGRIYHSSGRAAIATFKNCQFIGSYTDSASGGLKVFGGLVGGMTGAGRLNVSGCTINATVNGKSTDSAAGIGGVIGRISSARTVYISDTTAIGTYNGGKYAGGIIGNADTTSGIIKVTDCTAPGALCGNAGTRVEIITAK